MTGIATLPAKPSRVGVGHAAAPGTNGDRAVAHPAPVAAAALVRPRWVHRYARYLLACDLLIPYRVRIGQRAPAAKAA